MPCPLCDDTGWKPIDPSTSSGSPRAESRGEEVRRVVRCDCWREALSQKRLADANIPKRYQHCTIDKLRAYNDSLQEAVDSAARFVDSYPAVERGLLFLGHAGVGKTHLAVGLGLKACASGYSTTFTTAAGLIGALMRAHAESRLEEKLKVLVQPRLLIIDEIGYLPIDRLGANLFFQLVSRRYEKGSILLTSNQSLTVWGEVFGDRVIATAILDRLLHHSTIVNIKGESYRLKEKRKAGLLTRSEPFTQAAESAEPAQPAGA